MSDRTFTTSSGVVLKLKPVPAMALAPMQARLKQPEPPIEETTLGPKPNEGHPDYIAAMERYMVEMQEVMLAAMIGLGVEKLDIDYEAVKEIRDVMESPPINQKLNPNDKVIYVTMVLMTTEEEIKNLITAIQAITAPSPALVEAQVENFRADLPRAELVLNQAAALRAVS